MNCTKRREIEARLFPGVLGTGNCASVVPLTTLHTFSGDTAVCLSKMDRDK